MEFYAPNVNPFVRREASKTNTFDNSVLQDELKMPWLGGLLWEHRAARVAFDGKEALLWPAYAKLAKEYRRAAALVGQSCLPTAIAKAERAEIASAGYATFEKYTAEGGGRNTIPRRCTKIHAGAGAPRRDPDAGGGVRRVVQDLLRPLVPREFDPVDVPRAFLSLYGGTGRVSSEFGARGIGALLIDAASDARNYLGWREAEEAVLRALIGSGIGWLGIDLPCRTWSLARRLDGGPRPLRGSAPLEIYGLQSLAPAERRAVLAANLLASSACRLVLAASGLGVAGYIEDPASSRLSRFPPIRRLLKSGAG